jgi:hypothetical protein
MEGIMRARKSFLIAVICLVLGFIATVSLAQQAPDVFLPEELGAGAKLVVTSVSGPATAFLKQSISVTYNVKNQGTEASGAYQVGLYLSQDKTISPASDRLLKNVTFSTGLAPGVSKKTTTKVSVPVNGLSGKYYYCAIVGTSKKASSKQVSIVRYSLADDKDTVKDHKTGLIWQQADDGVLRDWADAKKYCKDLILGGHSDWRLPRVDELETIADFSRVSPAIDPVFEGRSCNYWSSSTAVDSPDYAWVVGFSGGNVYAYNKTYSHDDDRVRCVRSGPFWPFDPSTHLQTPSGKPGTVLDTYWGYMWQKGDSGATKLSWDQAKAYCEGLELDGYSDWRLPEIEALQTIVNYTMYSPALSTIFNPRRSNHYWSSSTYVYYPDSAWVVGFSGGNVYPDWKSDGSNYVRCMRGGP